MRKVILRCGFSPGDIVMLTAAVRDLHLCYLGQFRTDVRTACPDLWENNPFIEPLSEDEAEVEVLDCLYPLINRCTTTPYHCLHGFIEFLNQKLGLAIKPARFSGDIHLSPRERSWYSQVHEVTGAPTPFWIIAAGGKYDVTIKWWASERFQEVVDFFSGKILFVQVGATGHHHPKIRNTIDLRGQTTFRELIRLVYHAQGVLCPTTALMHLAAAVPGHVKAVGPRPCVVVAGAREPAHWEAYPGHQYIHTNAALGCCKSGACWRDRTFKLRDGDKRDHPNHLCADVVEKLPRCMDLITAEEVIRRIQWFFRGGALKYLTPAQRMEAERGIAATANNLYDRQALNLHSAGMACDLQTARLPNCPEKFKGRGIVLCAGGIKYFTCAWVCIHMLRRLGCTLPIELWHLGAQEVDHSMELLLKPLGVQCIDANKVRKRVPAKILNGWALKPYAILNSSFRQVLFLDADNVPVKNPEFLFACAEFRNKGAVFWPDYPRKTEEKKRRIWHSCGLRVPGEAEFETGQVLVDKERCWPALCLTMWFNENSDFYYRHLHGDKETFHLAFRKLRQPYHLVRAPVHPLEGTMCQHAPDGTRVFQHRNSDKWDFLGYNKKIAGFWREAECRRLVSRLRQVWDGRSTYLTANGKTVSARRRTAPTIKAVMISCAARDHLRRLTLKRLADTDWGNEPVPVEMDQADGADPKARQTMTALKALTRALAWNCDFLLFLEDDLDFNAYIRHNLEHWPPLRESQLTIGGLYNPGLRESACHAGWNARVIPPTSVYGSQAFIVSRTALDYIVRRWNSVAEMQDIRLSRLAGRLRKPILYHAPSLVQHIGTASTWGGRFHRACDFDAQWYARA